MKFRSLFFVLLLPGWFSPNLVSAFEPIELAPGYQTLSYQVPDPGSYRLPPLGLAADGKVIDGSGKEIALHDVFDGKYVLLSFMYSRCDDVNGCPLSTYVFSQILAAMQQEPELASRLKLISLSFDPEHDTAEVMQRYANNFRYTDNPDSWEFLSTASLGRLKPILENYDQDLQREYSVNGDMIRYAHILRVFLIDPELQIRNIYSVNFLHKDLLVNDVKTLLLESKNRPVLQTASLDFSVIEAGDDKSNYGSSDYQTRNRAIDQRQGKALDLLQEATRPQLGLPAVPQPADNPLTREKIDLGRKLFFDRRLSLNDTMSCAMCHVPEQGFTSHELKTAVGIEGRSVRRNSPTLYNSAYAELLFHDGREHTLEQQVWGPLLAINEMGNPSIGYLLNKIRKLEEYDGLFEAAFDGKPLTMETLGMALGSYQRSLVSGDSAFDRWYYGKQPEAFSESEVRGFELFTGKAGCASCHSISSTEALFTDQLLHNTGIGYRESMGIRPKTQRVQLAPGVFVDMNTDVIESVGEPVPADVGYYEITEDPADRWKYKTPGLRNVALTAPYMHNGSLPTLAAVVDFYAEGGVPNPLLDPRIRPLGLSDQEKHDLVAFLKGLTGSNVEAIVLDAFAAPVGDTRAE